MDEVVVILADLNFQCIILIVVACFWYQKKALAISYNLMLIF